MQKNRLIVGALAVLFASGTVVAQQPQRRRAGYPGQQQQAEMQQQQAEHEGDQQAGRPTPPPPPVEKTIATHHSAQIGGEEINYTATAGTYVIKDDAGNPKATFFYVAYTKDGLSDISKRPVSFVYNGGPGSASLFTHMGMGPKEVVLTPDGHGMPAPYSIKDNSDSFLDATDLVFIDAVSTGYSRPVAGQNPAQFYGVVQDAEIFSDFIYQYITRNERWDSPKFLIGESYGTTRSAELAGVLEHRHSMYLNGICLLSTMAFASWGADDRSEFYLPTYITTAWYHHLLSSDLQSLSAAEIAQRAREFAHGEYAEALGKGDEISPAEYNKVAADMAQLTALSPEYIKECDLRVSPFRWFAELMRNKRLIVGRLDSRFTGMNRDAAAESPEYDPSEASYLGAFVATFQDYVRRDLGWDDNQYYTVTGNVRPWDSQALPQVAEVLRSAMTEESTLKVLVLCGYYDLATPFNGIEETVSHMQLEPPIRKNISFAYYESGHMVYIDQKAHDKLHRDVDNFINSSYAH
ncbi:MAG: hypothetical protein WBE20_01350 [Candidatus Acidiferrales bacterium]